MCLIIIKNENKPLVNHEMIEEVWIDNPHGAGIVFKRHNSDTYQMLKGLMSELELHQAIKQLKLSEKDFIAYHLRWATSGEIDAATTHPFIVHEDIGQVNALSAHNSKKTMYLMHNGVIHDLNDKKAKFSDTQRFVSEYVSKLPLYDVFKNPAIKSMVEKFIDGSRLFLAHAKYGHILYGDWHEHGEYLISKPYKDATKSTYYNKFNSSNSNSNQSALWNDWDFSFEKQEPPKQITDDADWCDWCGRYETSKYINQYNGHVCSSCIKEFQV